MIRFLATVLSLGLLAGCTGKPDFNQESLGGPKLDLEEYFDGQVKAYGQFQDIFGKVRRRFEVDIEGEWDGQTLRLVEDFIYEDGSEEQRIWVLTKTDEDGWEGSAAGVLGTATGREDQDRFNWTYTIDLPIGDDETMRVSFNDWMWRLDEKRVLNRAYMKRFGIDIGEVIIFFERVD